MSITLSHTPRSATIAKAAEWIAAQRPVPDEPTRSLKLRFGLTSAEAAEALRKGSRIATDRFCAYASSGVITIAAHRLRRHGVTARAIAELRANTGIDDVELMAAIREARR